MLLCAGSKLSLASVSLASMALCKPMGRETGEAECSSPSPDVCCLSEAESRHLIGSLSDGGVAVWNADL